MKKVARDQILSIAAYEAERPIMRKRMFDIKAVRRVHMGEYLMFLFENADTTRYQVHEMLRIEGREKEDDILHELETYNDMLGDDGQLACTLFIEIDDPAERATLLREWLDLPKNLYLLLDDGSRAPAQFDPMQVGEDRVSAVQYLKFDCGSAKPVGLQSDLDGCSGKVEFTDEQRAALAQDLAS